MHVQSLAISHPRFLFRQQRVKVSEAQGSVAASPGLDHVRLCALTPSLLSLTRHGLTSTPTAGTHRFRLGSLGPHTGLCRAGRDSGSAVLQSHGGASSPASTRWGRGCVTGTAGPAGRPHALQRPVFSSKAAGQRGGGTPSPGFSDHCSARTCSADSQWLKDSPTGCSKLRETFKSFKKCHYSTVLSKKKKTLICTVRHSGRFFSVKQETSWSVFTTGQTR